MKTGKWERLYEEMRVEDYWDFDKIQKHMSVLIMSKTDYERLKEGVPYQTLPGGEFVAVYYVLLEAQIYGMSGFPITEKHLELWGMTQEELQKEIFPDMWECFR